MNNLRWARSRYHKKSTEERSPNHPMLDYQREFLAFAIDRGALKFGEFVLKSGRVSPYFFNTGAFDSGAALDQLGRAYAAAILAHGLPFDMLFGPAYKGIPLGSAVAISFARDHGLDIPVAFNRKEAKDHGEGGVVLGAALRGRVLIVDDVISAGTSVRESVELIHAAGGQTAGVAISLDRQERGLTDVSAVQEVERGLNMPVIRIVSLKEVLAFLRERGNSESDVRRIEAYRKSYGVDD